MADTVVTLGGDSSGLQDAFKDAGKKAEELKAESKKLTDQLKEVADEADKAAGALVNKIGGPGAIKAIAGIGGAIAAVKTGVEAFLDSSEALFRSYGEEGQRVWDETEKKLFAIKGAFAAAVLGGGEMEDQAARLSQLFTGTRDVLTSLLTPLSAIADAFYEVAFYETEATKANNAYAASKDRAEKEAAERAAAAKADADQSRNLLRQAASRVGLGQFAAAAQLQDEANTYLMENKKILAVVAAKVKAEIAKMPEFNPPGFVSPAGRRRLNDNMTRMMKDYGDTIEQMGPGFIQLMERFGFKEEAQKLGIFSEAAREASNEADRVRVAAGKAKKEAEDWEAPARPAVAPARRATPAKEATEDLTVFVMETENGLAVLTEAQGKAYQEAERMMGDSTSRLIEMKQSELAQIEQFRQDNATAEIAIETDKIARIEKEREDAMAREKATAEAQRAEKQRLDEAEAQRQIDLAKRVADEKAAAQAKMMADLYVLTVNNSAKMLAVDLQDAEKSKTASQRATAAVISGLGDMAMVKSGLAAAAGNFAEAAAYSVAGTFAYGLAAKLAPTEKSKTTPPAAATNAPTSTNVSYNLRVDAAFADGESVARRFAEMQRGAQRRGLV